MDDARTRKRKSPPVRALVCFVNEKIPKRIKFLDSFDLFVRIVYICSNSMPVIPLMEGSGWDTYT